MDFHGFDLEISNHGEAISRMPDVFADGRNLRDGYIRSCGVQMGNFPKLFHTDQALREATDLAKGQLTALDEMRLANLYLLIRYFLPRFGVGHIAEFGVDKGGSALFMARIAKEYLPNAKVYCFDSFAGMPESSPNDAHQKGDFNHSEQAITERAAKAGLDNIVIVKGFFEDTLAQCPDNLLLAHFDCDLYQSVADCYKGTLGKIVPRGYLVFDDAFASSCMGAFDAISEYVIRRDGRLPEQVCPHMVFRAI